MKIIKIKENGLGRYTDVSPFPLGDLTLKVTGLPAYAEGEFRLILHFNSWKIGSYTIYPKGENVITVPQEKLSAGRLSCYVSFYQGGHEVKRYLIEDLIITALNDGLTAYPEIAKIEAKINELAQTGNSNKQSADTEFQKIITLINTQNSNNERAFSGFTNTVSLLSQSVASLTNFVKEIKNALDAEHNKVLALLKFAWADYKENIYIEGETFEEFIKMFGFNLTDEEIKTVKGEN